MKTKLPRILLWIVIATTIIYQQITLVQLRRDNITNFTVIENLSERLIEANWDWYYLYTGEKSQTNERYVKAVESQRDDVMASYVYICLNEIGHVPPPLINMSMLEETK
jgi:hypothetical protein